MKQLTLRSQKQSPLTSTEVDDNFLFLLQEIQTLKEGGVTSKETHQGSQDQGTQNILEKKDTSSQDKTTETLGQQCLKDVETYKNLYHQLKKEWETYQTLIKEEKLSQNSSPIILQSKNVLEKVAPYTLAYKTIGEEIKLCIHNGKDWSEL